MTASAENVIELNEYKTQDNNININENQHCDGNEFQEKHILEVQTKPNETHLISKYQHTPNEFMIFIEWIRWKFNLILLFRPFAFLSYIPIKWHIHQCLYRLTITEIIFYLILIIIAYEPTTWFISTLSNEPILILDSQSVIGGGDGGESGSGESSEGGHGGESGEDSGDRAQIVFVIAWILALRNTLWNILFGLSFERAIQFHRSMGRFAVLLCFYHFWEYRNYNWFKGDCYSGSMALIPMILIIITSLNIFRRNIFTIFFKLHWILVIMSSYYCFEHGASLVIIPILLTIIDIMYRWWLTFGKPVIIKDLKILHGNVIRIVFDKKDFRYEPGQYVFICLPAIDFTQYHPFSLSSSPHDPHNISIHIRVLGDWTSKLKQLAAHYEDKNNTDWSDLTCFMEGPYGELQVPLHQYQSIVMISGGIGITPLQSIFNEIVHNISSNSNGRIDDFIFNDSKIKRIHFVWTVRDPSIIGEFHNNHWSGIKYKDITYYNQNAEHSRLPKYFSPDLLIVKKQTQIVQRTEIMTHFYITRVLDEEIKQKYQQKYAFLKFGRPSIEEILKEAKDEYISNNNNNLNKIDCIDSCITKGSGITVLCCGPNGMLKDVKKYATKYAIDFHGETFQF